LSGSGLAGAMAVTNPIQNILQLLKKESNRVNSALSRASFFKEI
jgi:hypothetical protein